MTIKKLSKYQTSDGQMFDDKEAAQSHENELHAMGELSRLLAVSIRTGRADSILREMLMEAPMVQAILRGYIKRCPKAKVEEKAIAA